MSKLPEEFAGLERFADWCLPTEEERYAKRLASSMEQMQELYDAGMARLEDIMVYVDARFPLAGMPDDAKALVHLGQSIVMVSFPIEVWKQPQWAAPSPRAHMTPSSISATRSCFRG